MSKLVWFFILLKNDKFIRRNRSEVQQNILSNYFIVPSIYPRKYIRIKFRRNYSFNKTVIIDSLYPCNKNGFQGAKEIPKKLKIGPSKNWQYIYIYIRSGTKKLFSHILLLMAHCTILYF